MTMTGDDVVRAVRLALRETEQGLPGGVNLRAIKHLRDAGGGSIHELAPIVAVAIAEIRGDDEAAAVRERLARHLYVDSGGAAFFWDQRQVDRAPWLAKADTILNVIAGKEA